MKKLIISFIVLMIAVSILAQTPEWLMVERAGGAEFDDGLSISLDIDGNIYVTGIFELTASFGSYNITSNGMHDIFIAKMDPDGNWLWATSAGGIHDDFGYSISVGELGYVYVTGSFQETASFGPYVLASSGAKDIFVAKINSEGDWLWVSQAGGSDSESGISIKADVGDSVYVTGIFKGSANFGSYNLSSNGEYDIFIAKIDPAGTWLWANNAGGTSDDYSYSIDTEPAGNVFITGAFTGTADFDTNSLTSNGAKDIFVAKTDPDGNWLWVENFGGSLDDTGNSINVDIVDDLYVTGSFSGTASFGSTNLSSNGVYDIFASKMDTNGNLIWVESAGGTDYDFGNSICTDLDGNVYITGGFAETVDFDVTTLTGAGGRDIFVAGINPNEGTWLWAEGAGGAHNDKGNSITVDLDGFIYVGGHFVASAWFNGFNLISAGEYDVFIAKMSGSTSADSEIVSNEHIFLNYPNPFNPTTTINYSLKENAKVSLNIYNIKGQKVKQLVSDQLSAGEHSVVWNGTDYNGKSVSSGIYFYKLKTRNYEKTKKMVLLK